MNFEKRRSPLKRSAALFLLVAVVLIGSALLRHPDTPLPDRWNVFEPLLGKRSDHAAYALEA